MRQEYCFVINGIGSCVDTTTDLYNKLESSYLRLEYSPLIVQIAEAMESTAQV